MALDDLIRSAVATAHSVTGSLQATVTHEAWTGQDDTGAPTYATAVSRTAVVEFKQRLRRTTGGQEVMQKASVTFLAPVTANGASNRREPIDPRDRLTLPNGYTGPILDVQGVTDPDTTHPYVLEVMLG